MSRLFVLLLAAGGCGRIDFDGLYANAFVVDTALDRMAGAASITSPDELPAGTAGLSLREAMTMAANTPGTDLIEFDRAVFSQAAPVAILLGSELPAVASAGTVIDARFAGVVLDVAPGYDGTLVRITAPDAELRGLTFRGGSQPRLAIVADLATISGNRFEAPGGTAIDAMGSALVLDSNTIVDPASDAIHVQGDRVRVTSNTITRSAGTALVVTASTALLVDGNAIEIGDLTSGLGVQLQSVTASTVSNNVIDPGVAWMISLLDSSNIDVIGNILDRGDSGVVLMGASTHNFVFRNVVIDCNDDAVFLDTTTSGNLVLNNTFDGCGLVDNAPDTMTGNNLDATDGFVDPTTYDFHLVPGSAAIDQGTDYGYDLLPASPLRFLGAAPDLGAVETD